jgi:hypothetical protein
MKCMRHAPHVAAQLCLRRNIGGFISIRVQRKVLRDLPDEDLIMDCQPKIPDLYMVTYLAIV